jgi:hypothetical protein
VGDGREEQSPNGFGLQDRAVLFLLNFAGQFEPEPKCCIAQLFDPRRFSLFFLFLIRTSGGVQKYHPRRVRLRLRWEIHVFPERIRPDRGQGSFS